MKSDEELLLDYRRGARERSEKALADLFARYRDPLFGFFYRRTLDRNRAEDLVQETFVSVMTGRERYEARAPVRSYLFGIAFRVLAAERRRHGRLTALLVDEPGEASHVDAELAVRKALSLLQETEREMVMLREYEQLSYGEIAEVLSIPVNTVRSRLFRARMALKRYLEPIQKIAAQSDSSGVRAS